MPGLTKSRAMALLRRALAEITPLKARRGSPEFKKWRRSTKVAISHTFGDLSEHVKEFGAIQYSLRIFGSYTTESDFQEAYASGLETAAAMLESMIEEVEEYWEIDTERGKEAGTQPLQGESAQNGYLLFMAEITGPEIQLPDSCRSWDSKQ